MTDWRGDALCAEVDPELFFPEKGHGAQLALSVCQRCPVREECLQFALTLPGLPVVGVWGGASAAGRDRMRGRRRGPSCDTA